MLGFFCPPRPQRFLSLSLSLAFSQATATGVPPSPTPSLLLLPLIVLVPSGFELNRLSPAVACFPVPPVVVVVVEGNEVEGLLAGEFLWMWRAVGILLREEGFSGRVDWVDWVDWEMSRHLRQPSKSMRACMHPHSITLRSSQTKFTGYKKKKRGERGGHVSGVLIKVELKFFIFFPQKTSRDIPWLENHYIRLPGPHACHFEVSLLSTPR